MTSVRWIVTGTVQGVFFRKHTVEAVERINKARTDDSAALVGFVRNIRKPECVEVVAHGTAEQLDALHAFLQCGSPKAQVASVTRTELAAHDPAAMSVAQMTRFEQEATR
jgi:acylphosphatase